MLNNGFRERLRVMLERVSTLGGRGLEVTYRAGIRILLLLLTNDTKKDKKVRERLRVMVERVSTLEEEV